MICFGAPPFQHALDIQMSERRIRDTCEDNSVRDLHTTVQTDIDEFGGPGRCDADKYAQHRPTNRLHGD